MASDETMTFQSSLQDEDFDDDIDDGFDHQTHHQYHHHPHNLSRLSVCTSSTLCGADDVDVDDDVDNAMSIYVSHLSIESFDGDADGEFSDGKEELQPGLSSDSDTEHGSCYSLPATPPRRRNRVSAAAKAEIAVKEYASDNEAQKGTLKTKNSSDPRRRRRSRRSIRDRWVFDRVSSWENPDQKMKKKEVVEELEHVMSGESDQSVGGGSTGTGSGVMLITRPKGGRRSLCMDLEEVKACRDLGFELEHERMLEMQMQMPSSRLSHSNSTLDTSSGGNSPIANWRISGPGDDPRDVKARLKVWAQAVALASASKYGT